MKAPLTPRKRKCSDGEMGSIKADAELLRTDAASTAEGHAALLFSVFDTSLTKQSEQEAKLETRMHQMGDK